MTNHENKENSDIHTEHNPNVNANTVVPKNPTPMPISTKTQNQINTSVINQNIPPQFCLPAMYFPNSNVTINYNFKQ